MNDLKMTLANGEEVAIDSFSLPLHVVVNRVWEPGVYGWTEVQT